jgi:predicted RNA-binding protein with PIN domain
MPVLIDGDNLLHVARGALEEAHLANRAWLCRMLASWADRYHQEVTVVFDGVRPSSSGEGPLAQAALLIRYSDTRKADDVIIEMIGASSSPRRLVVVSSDRQIRASARRRKARSVDSPSFIERVIEELSRSTTAGEREPIEKYQGLQEGDAEYWLKQFGLHSESPFDSDL